MLNGFREKKCSLNCVIICDSRCSVWNCTVLVENIASYSVLQKTSTCQTVIAQIDSISSLSKVTSRLAKIYPWGVPPPPPPMWPGFHSGPVQYVGWVCCWYSSLLRGFFPGSPVFLPPQKKNISKFQFDQDRGPAWKPVRTVVASSINIVNLLFPLMDNIKTDEAVVQFVKHPPPSPPPPPPVRPPTWCSSPTGTTPSPGQANNRPCSLWLTIRTPSFHPLCPWGDWSPAHRFQHHYNKHPHIQDPQMSKTLHNSQRLTNESLKMDETVQNKKAPK